MSSDSSNITQSVLSRVAKTRQGSTESIASSKSNEAYLSVSSKIPIDTLSTSAISTRPRSVCVTAPSRYDVTLRGVLDLFHIENFSNASEEEVMFLFSLYSVLCIEAKKLARDLNGEADRVYQALLSVLCKESAIISPPAPLRSTGGQSIPAPSLE